MAFGDSNQRGGAGTRQESPYLRLPPGERIIRILDDEEVSFWRYFIPVNVGGKQKSLSIVVAQDNPIKRLMDQVGPDSESFRKVERRMLLNVLDRSPIVRWMDGTTLYPNEQNQFVNPETGKLIVNPGLQPNNRVMILEFGSQLMDFFKAYHKRLRNRDNLDETLPVQRVDLRIATMGTGLNTKRTVMADGDTAPLPDELLNLPRYDLKKLTSPMPNEAVQRLLDGADYNDVLASLGWERLQPLW